MYNLDSGTNLEIQRTSLHNSDSEDIDPTNIDETRRTCEEEPATCRESDEEGPSLTAKRKKFGDNWNILS